MRYFFMLLFGPPHHWPDVVGAFTTASTSLLATYYLSVVCLDFSDSQLSLFVPAITAALILTVSIGWASRQLLVWQAKRKRNWFLSSGKSCCWKSNKINPRSSPWQFACSQIVLLSGNALDRGIFINMHSGNNRFLSPSSCSRTKY